MQPKLHRAVWSWWTRAVGCGVLIVFACANVGLSQAEQQLDRSIPFNERPIDDEAGQDVLDMDLEQLSRADVLVPAMDTVVSSVSRQESTVGRSPAAVFVITPEMIRRSGAINIPDLLRMVPGVEVARIDANKWAVTARGFNGRLANKLLVQIDGRSVYAQSSGGVFWDMQDVVLQDVERIEVIRGPGATVWGANAVNGVINIITKRASDTQGVLVSAGSGSEERLFSTVRYGSQIGEDLSWRIYGKQYERDGGYFSDDAFDDARQARGGFRADWTPSTCDTVTMQGDFYEGASGTLALASSPVFPFLQPRIADTTFNAQNYLMRWTHVIDDDSDWTWQAYYDEWDRTEPFANNGQKTFDFDFHHRFPWGERQNIIYGMGYRHIDDHVFFDPALGVVAPPVLGTNLFSYFIQDEIALEEDRWYLTAGSKFEHNDFTGFEFQPSIRLLFLPTERASAWAAVSRAVRTPNRIEQHITTDNVISPFGPVFSRLSGNDNLVAEELLAFEAGYRAQPVDTFSWDLVGFYNNYENLIGVLPSGAPFFDPGIGAIVVPVRQANSLSADTYGVELSSTFQLNPKWELTAAYTWLYLDIHASSSTSTQGASPNNQMYLRSSWTPRCDLEFDVIGRYVDNLPALGVSSYLTMDVRAAWRPSKNLEWAVVGRNLLDSHHAEFTDTLGGTIGTEVQPEVFTTLTWTY